MQDCNSKDENVLMSDMIGSFSAKVKMFDNEFGGSKLSDFVMEFTRFISEMNTLKLDDTNLHNFLDKNFMLIADRLGNSYLFDKEKMGLNKKLVMIMIDKIVFVFKNNKKYLLAISTFRSIFARKNGLFYS